ELQVQALALDPKQKGVIYAATSPDGKVYRIQRGAGGAKEAEEISTDATSEPAAANATPNGQSASQKNPAANESFSAEAKQNLEREKERPALSSVPVDPNYAS